MRDATPRPWKHRRHWVPLEDRLQHQVVLAVDYDELHRAYDAMREALEACYRFRAEYMPVKIHEQVQAALALASDNMSKV